MQFNLFTQQENQVKDQILTDKANDLLNLLNDGKEQYNPWYYDIVNEFVILIAKHSKENIFVFNMLKNDGTTPTDCSSNWRDLTHVKSDLKKLLK